MKTRFDKAGFPVYCDAGPYEGDMRVDLMLRVYLSPQEYARYEGPESLHITLGEPVADSGAAEPSSEPRAGGAGPAARPLPAPDAPGEPPSHPAASTVKEHTDGRP